MPRHLTLLFWGGLAVMLFTATVWGQTTSATIVGDVSDSSRGVIAGATITVKNVATGLTRQTTTLENGTFRVFPLNPGTYEVTASDRKSVV